MQDLIVVAILVAFFAVAAAFVAACDKIIGPDVAVEQGETGEAEEAPVAPVAAPAGGAAA